MHFFEEALKETRASVTPEMEREYEQLAESLKRESPRGRAIGFERHPPDGKAQSSASSREAADWRPRLPGP